MIMMRHAKWNLFLLLLPAMCAFNYSHTVFLKEPFSFPCDSSKCNKAELKIGDSNHVIARYSNALWTIERDFTQDFKVRDNKLLLKAAQYKDNGRYECVCDQEKNQIVLQVLYALNIQVTEGENITLPCHGIIADVTWLHNQTKILHYERGGVKYIHQSLTGRGQVEESCFSTGNYTLTINGVQKTDSGGYQCYINSETKEGYPHSYFLHYKDKDVKTPDTSCKEETYKMIIIVILSIVCIVLCGFFVYFKACDHIRFQCLSKTSRTDRSNREEVKMLPINAEATPNLSVQESITNNQKSSSTVTSY